MDKNLPISERKIIFGKRLKKARKAAGYRTQSQLAESLKITKDTIENWEQGKAYPTIDGFLRLCDLLGCSTDYLLGRIDEKNHDVQFIHDFTGLDGNAIDELHGYHADAQHILSGLIVSSDFHLLLLRIERLMWSIATLLKARDNVVSDTSDDNVRSFFSMHQQARINSYEIDNGFSRLLESFTKAQATIDSCTELRKLLLTANKVKE